MGEIFDPEGYDSSINDIQPSDPGYIKDLKKLGGYATSTIGNSSEYYVGLVLEIEGLIQGSRFSRPKGLRDLSGVDMEVLLPESTEKVEGDDTVFIQVKSSGGGVKNFKKELKKQHHLESDRDLERWILENRLVILNAADSEQDIVNSFNRQRSLHSGTPRNISFPDEAEVNRNDSDMGMDEAIAIDLELYPLTMGLRKTAKRLKEVIYKALPPGHMLALPEEDFYLGWYRFVKNSTSQNQPAQIHNSRVSVFHQPTHAEVWPNINSTSVLTSAQAFDLKPMGDIERTQLAKTILSLPERKRLQFIREVAARYDSDYIFDNMEDIVNAVLPIFISHSAAKGLERQMEHVIHNYMVTTGTNIYEYALDQCIVVCGNPERYYHRNLYIPQPLQHIFQRGKIDALTLEELELLYREHVDPNYDVKAPSNNAGSDNT